MRTRIMRARARARARARGDTPWICSRINYFVEDYRRAVLGSSKNQPGHSGILRRTSLASPTGLYRCAAVYTLCTSEIHVIHRYFPGYTAQERSQERSQELSQLVRLSCPDSQIHQCTSHGNAYF